jgi:flagellar hook-associated protein 2
MGLVTQAGIGSGIDAEAIIDALLNAERSPRESSFTRIEIQSNATISGIGTLKSSLSQLQDSIENLTSENFNARSAASSDDTQLTATANSNSSVGNFDVTIVQTASITELSSGTIVGDSNTVLGDGNLTIENANLDSFSIAVGATDTLADIVYAINNSVDNIGVTATLVNGDSGTKIIYRGTDTGALNDFTVTNDNANLAQISDGNGGLLNVDDTADDAELTIAGLSVTSGTNKFTEPVLGVDITLDPDAVAGVVNVTVNKEPQTVKDNIQQFVDDYNSYITTANKLGNATIGSQGELVGDSNLRIVTRQINSVVSTVVASSPTGFDTLSQVGITTERDGTLSIDSAVLDASLDANFDAVGNLFYAADGIGTILEDAIDPYTEFSGILDKRTDSMQIILDRVEEDRLRLDVRIDSLEMSLRSKFAAMDTLVSRFNFTGRFLEQQFASLSGNNDK